MRVLFARTLIERGHVMPELLRAIDRCDRCGAQALVVAVAPVWRSALLFCGHHHRAHAVALAAQGAVVTRDEHLTTQLAQPVTL